MKIFRGASCAMGWLVLSTATLAWSCDSSPSDVAAAGAAGVSLDAGEDAGEDAGGSSGRNALGGASSGLAGASGADSEGGAEQGGQDSSGTGGATSGAGGATSGGGGATSGGGGATSGGGGATSGGGGAGGAGTLVLSTQSITFVPVFCGGGPNPPQSFTITNTGGSTVAWSGTVNPSPALFSLAPAGGAIPAGGALQVTVTPAKIEEGALLPKDLPTLNRTITIVGAASGPQTIDMHENVVGASFDWSPQSLNFGAVPLGSSKSLDVTVNYGIATTTPKLSSNDAGVFTPSNFDSNQPNSWHVTFTPSTAGPKSATLTWFSLQAATCTPHTFIARGSGAVAGAMGCVLAGAINGTPCGDGKVCGPLPGACTTELTLTGNAGTFTPGAVFAGTVATGTDVMNNPADMSASIAWGDSTVSAGTINSSWQYVGSPATGGPLIPLTVSGSHSYAAAGTYAATATITDSVTGFSASAAFTVTGN